MPDEPKGKAPQAPEIFIAEGFPPPTVPCLFCDGVANFAPGHQVVKFYLFRTDPDAAGRNSYKNQVFAQIAMSVDGFVNVSFFVETAIKHMIATGALSPERINVLRNTFETISRQLQSNTTPGEVDTGRSQ
jgi:hypothetical protein